MIYDALTVMYDNVQSGRAVKNGPYPGLGPGEKVLGRVMFLKYVTLLTIT